jgi:hypothetical protein
LWSAPETTHEERKEVIRCLADRVVVQVSIQEEDVGIAIHWRGGHVTRHTTIRGLGTYEQMPRYAELMAAVRRWHADGWTTTQIAEKLNQDAYRTPRRHQPFTRVEVLVLLQKIGLSGGRLRPEELHKDEWWVCNLAAHLRVGAATVRRWIARQWVRARRSRDRHQWIVWADRDDLKRLRSLADLVKVGANEFPIDLTTPPVR